MIYILYSNDYELFLGGNHIPEDQVLIEPTKEILSVCESIDIPMTLFCDIACLWRYRELGFSEFPDAVDEQLRTAIMGGHDVQAHLHPHWLTTEICRRNDGGTRYIFDLSQFLLGNWAPDGGPKLYEFCLDIFSRAKTYLERLLSPVKSGYECVAFRAGGYGIQPHTSEILAALMDSGFLIDSSVVPGLVLESNVNRVDFSQVPRQGNYHISPEHGLAQDSEQGLFEIPILALGPGVASRLLLRLLIRKILNRILGRTPHRSFGYTVQSVDPQAQRSTLTARLQSHWDIIRHGWFMLELCPHAGVMTAAVRRYCDLFTHRNGRDIYFAVICHSKNMTKMTLDAMVRFHNQLKRHYGAELKAITFQDAAHQVSKRQHRS